MLNIKSPKVTWAWRGSIIYWEKRGKGTNSWFRPGRGEPGHGGCSVMKRERKVFFCRDLKNPWPAWVGPLRRKEGFQTMLNQCLPFSGLSQRAQSGGKVFEPHGGNLTQGAICWGIFIPRTPLTGTYLTLSLEEHLGRAVPGGKHSIKQANLL